MAEPMTTPTADGQGWREFFSKHEDYTLQTSFYECRRDFTIEELYQAFSARLIEELSSPPTSGDTP